MVHFYDRCRHAWADDVCVCNFFVRFVVRRDDFQHAVGCFFPAADRPPLDVGLLVERVLQLGHEVLQRRRSAAAFVPCSPVGDDDDLRLHAPSVAGHALAGFKEVRPYFCKAAGNVSLRDKAFHLRVLQLPDRASNVAAPPRRLLPPDGCLSKLCKGRRPQVAGQGAVVHLQPASLPGLRERPDLANLAQVTSRSHFHVVADLQGRLRRRRRQRSSEHELDRRLRFKRGNRHPNPAEEDGFVQLFHNTRSKVQLLLVVSFGPARELGFNRGGAVNHEEDIGHRVAPVCCRGGAWRCRLRRRRRRGRGGGGACGGRGGRGGAGRC